MVITFGFKEKTEEAVSEKQTKEVSGKEKPEELISEEQTKQFVFNLDEVSVFDLDKVLSRDFLRGQSIFCDNRPWNRPGKYPAFKSQKPLYGNVHFTGAPIGPRAPNQYRFAIDESAGTGQGYDCLYFDHNCDLDLTNDTPLASLQNPPDGVLLGYPSTEQEVCFESFEVTFDLGSAGKRAIEIMPRLMIRQGGHSGLSFIVTKVRKGQIDIGGARYDALLGYTYSVGKPLDQPGTAFYLIPKSEPEHPFRWWGANRLNSTHAIGDKYYRFATTPVGDKLFVRPYKGQLGTFEVGAGGRNIQEIAMQGSLRSEDTAVAVRGEMERGWPKPAKSCRLPVGDYLPAYLTITFGRLSISVSNNYHADGLFRRPSNRPSIYGIKIREDKSYVFDFSNKPEVIFASPAKNHRVKLGKELTVKAVLIDPELDIMIRRLYDTTRKQKKEYATSDGQKRTFERDVSLDPKVVITRADGETVAEGVMPFG
jgi:hypothetical protein